jgi:RimJ/RimL family protein N-acetyltransferase
MSAPRADVSLVHLTQEHAPRTYELVLDPVVRLGLGLREEPTLAKTSAWISRAAADPAVHAFAILQAGDHVGNVVLDRLDTYLASARLSVYVGAAARGAGVGRTAVELAVRFGFEQLRLHKVWLTVHAENFAALATYLKVGFVLEGILRDEFLLDGRRLAAVVMGLLREEFLNRARASATGGAS